MWEISGQKFEFRFVDILAAEKFISPTLELKFSRSSKINGNQPSQDLIITNMNMQLYVKQDEYNIKILGFAISKVLQQTWKANDHSNPEFFMQLDHYILHEIEKMRANNDLNLYAELVFHAYPTGNIPDIKPYSISLDFSVPKSKWVEKILPNLKYKNVALVEISRLEYPKMNQAIDKLDAAWRSYSGGDIDDVLTKCRQTLEELRNQVMAANFMKKEPTIGNDGKQYMKKVPDWDKFLGSKSKGDMVDSIISKMFNFVAPGAHAHGEGILVMNHAYFALLQTFSLTHLIVSRFKMVDEQKNSVRTRNR
jgi:hypothetical protein